jgi:hypothetical protein
MVHGRTGGALERERCAGASDRGRRALPAAGSALRRGRAAPIAPGGLQDAEAAAACRAERPRPLATPRTSGREHDVERPAEHRPTISAASDSPLFGYGRSTMTGARDPRAEIESFERSLEAG